MAGSNQNIQGGKTAGERIAKAIARSGLCSRREAEALIEERRVAVNGAVIESAALDILPSDTVLVDGKPLSPREAPRLWRYHKPKGRVTTHKDPEGRPTVFERLPEGLPRLISVGRLDFNTEGLLLLTNDGDLARHLELPSTGWTRRYRVRAFGQVGEDRLKALGAGTTIDKMKYGPIEAALEREQGDNIWISVSIREGKNREVRRIMEHLGLTVNRLIRVSFGPFMLGDLEPGQIEEVKTAVLKDQLGARLSRQLGVRREPMREERKLAPGRGKPTYLRRKPAPEERPRRPEPEERPLKRRRVLPMDGSEAPKVEYVSEKKPRLPRKDGRAERPYREGRDDRPARAGSAQPRHEEETRRAGGYSTDRPKFASQMRGESDRSFRGDRAGPASIRKRPESDSSSRPRFENKERASYGAGTEKRDRGGKHAPFAPRLDATTEGARPERTFHAKGPRGASEERKPRERTGERPRNQFRRDQEAPRGGSEERKPRERSFDRSGGSRPPGKRGEGKPFRSGGKTSHPRHSAGPRKPRPKPEPDKETP